MEKELLERLIDFVEGASPVVWEAAMKQVQVSLIQSLMWVVFFIISASVCFYLGRWQWKWYKELTEGGRRGRGDDHDAMAVVLWIIAAFLLIVAFMGIVSSLGRIINPEYYAIKELVGFLP